MPQTIDDLSDEEEARYYRAYFATWDAVDRTVTILQRRKLTPGVGVEELNEIEVDLLWCASEHAKLKLRRTAFIRGTAAAEPPSDEQVEAIRKLADRVEKLAVNARATSRAIDLATEALAKFGEIQAPREG
jgi:hypothetical protein